MVSFTPNSVSSPPCTSNLWGERTLAFLDGASASASWEARVQPRCHTCVPPRVSRMREAQKGKFHLSSPATLVRPWPEDFPEMGLGTQGLPSGVSRRRHRFPGVIRIVEGEVMAYPQGRPGDTTGALGSSTLSKKL